MSESKRPRGKYKTTTYNAALKARGSLTVWLDRDMQWYATTIGKRGRQQVFSDRVIQLCLSAKSLFGLVLRQSLGLVEGVLRLAVGGVGADRVVRVSGVVELHTSVRRFSTASASWVFL